MLQVKSAHRLVCWMTRSFTMKREDEIGYESVGIGLLLWHRFAEISSSYSKAGHQLYQGLGFMHSSCCGPSIASKTWAAVPHMQVTPHLHSACQ